MQDFLNKSRFEEFYNVRCGDLGQIALLKSRDLSMKRILKSCNYLSLNQLIRTIIKFSNMFPLMTDLIKFIQIIALILIIL